MTLHHLLKKKVGLFPNVQGDVYKLSFYLACVPVNYLQCSVFFTGDMFNKLGFLVKHVFFSDIFLRSESRPSLNVEAFRLDEHSKTVPKRTVPKHTSDTCHPRNQVATKHFEQRFCEHLVYMLVKMSNVTCLLIASTGKCAYALVIWCCSLTFVLWDIRLIGVTCSLSFHPTCLAEA